jgi:hypothetical protein
MILITKNLLLSCLISLVMISVLKAVPQKDELVQLHNVTMTEMSAIASPVTGSLVFNSDDKEIYEYNSTAWHKFSSDGSETKVIAGNCVEVTGSGTTINPYIVKDKQFGEKKTTAGQTCKDILDNGCNVRDGVYWINPNGGTTADAFEVYCDMTGGGWTRIDYANDLLDTKRFASNDAWRWVTTNFSLTLTDTQINDIRAVSNEGKQTYVSQCDGVITYYYNAGGSYNYAFGFRFQAGFETAFGQQNYTGININVIQDGCNINRSYSLDTIFEINDLRVPVINVYSYDTGGGTETFGSPLTNNPAWFR